MPLFHAFHVSTNFSDEYFATEIETNLPHELQQTLDRLADDGEEIINITQGTVEALDEDEATLKAQTGCWETIHHQNFPIPPRQLIITLDLGNAAMKTGDDIAKALHDIANQIINLGLPNTPSKVYDQNGNPVGTFTAK